MKKSGIISVLCLLFAAGMVCSCGGGEATGEGGNGDSIVLEEPLVNEEVLEMSVLINEVALCLDSIQVQEKTLYASLEGAGSKEDILVQLRGFKDLLTRKQSQIDALTAQNKSLTESSKSTIQNLQKMVEYLTDQMAEKSKQIESLEESLQRKDAKIDELRYNVNALSQESDYLKEQNFQQDVELNAVYYIVDTKSNLKDAGLLKTGLFSKKVKNENIDKSLFKKADKRSFKQLVIDVKSPKILTNNPADSYTITKNDDGTTTLLITDSDKFWNVSSYLIIQK